MDYIMIRMSGSDAKVIAFFGNLTTAVATKRALDQIGHQSSSSLVILPRRDAFLQFPNLGV